MNEIPFLSFENDPWAVVVSEEPKNRIVSVPKEGLDKNGPWLVGNSGGTAHESNTKDMSRGG